MKKHAYLYEIPVFYILFCVINYFFVPDRPGFYEIHPHPYWLGILLFGMRYGVFAGLGSGIISAALYLSSVWFFGTRYLFEDLPFYSLPSFFIIFGVLVGVGVQRYQNQINTLRMNLSQSMSSNKILTDDLNTQKLINSALEKRIITKTATLITLYEGARKLESIDIEEIYSAILDFFTKTLNLEQAAIYKRSEQGWHLTKQHGWPENTSWPHDYPFGTGRLVAMVGASKKIMSIRDIITTSPQDTALKKQLSELNLQNECLMAGPLRNGENGEVEAVFAIQAMKLLDLNSATINLFTFLLSWANRAIARAHYFMQLEDQEIIDPRYNVYSYRYFEARLQQEFLRAKTYYLPLSLMLIHVPGLGEMNAEKHKVLLTSISQVLKNHCRGTDIISLYHENDIPFACLLTTTAQSKAEELKSTILNNFNELGLSDHAKLIVGTSHFTPAVNSLQNIIELAKKDLTNAA